MRTKDSPHDERDEKAMSVEDVEKLHIEPARYGDAIAIAMMSRDLIEQGLRWTWKPARVKRELYQPDTLGVVARHEEHGIVGFALMRYQDTSAHLLLFAVSKQWRREGVGKALLAWLETCARVAGTFTIHLEVRASNMGARAFYSALGYQEAALVAGYYQGQESAVRMIRDVSVRQGRFFPRDP